MCYIYLHNIFITTTTTTIIVIVIVMVQLIPVNANPTMAEIDAYICKSHTTSGGMAALKIIVREIHSKSGAGALLHPADEYFVSRYSALLEHRN